MAVDADGYPGRHRPRRRARLAKQPERRYETARKFAEAIQRVAQGKPLEGHDDVFSRPARPRSPAARPTRSREGILERGKDSTDPDELDAYI